jgi:hypothetical protein
MQQQQQQPPSPRPPSPRQQPPLPPLPSPQQTQTQTQPMRRIAAAPESSDIFYNRTIALLVADLIYVLVFFMLFTEIGYGASMFRFLSARHASASTPLAVAGGILVVIYVLDVRSWRGKRKSAKSCLFGAAGVCVLLGAFLSFQNYPWVPLACFLLFQPPFHLLLKKRCFPRVAQQHFLRSMAAVSTAVAVFMALISLVFYAAGNDNTQFFWGKESRLEFIRRLTDKTRDDGSVYEFGECDAVNMSEWKRDELHEPGAHDDDCPCKDIMGVPSCLTETPDDSCYCLAAFLLWGSSAMAALALCAYAMLFVVLLRTSRGDGR